MIRFVPVYLTDKQESTLKEMMSFGTNDILNYKKLTGYYDYGNLIRLYLNPFLLYNSRFAEENLEFFIDFTINRYEEEIAELNFMKQDGQINSGELKKIKNILDEKYFTGSFMATNIYRIKEKRETEKVKVCKKTYT